MIWFRPVCFKIYDSNYIFFISYMTKFTTLNYYIQYFVLKIYHNLYKYSGLLFFHLVNQGFDFDRCHLFSKTRVITKNSASALLIYLWLDNLHLDIPIYQVINNMSFTNLIYHVLWRINALIQIDWKVCILFGRLLRHNKRLIRQKFFKNNERNRKLLWYN